MCLKVFIIGCIIVTKLIRRFRKKELADYLIFVYFKGTKKSKYIKIVPLNWLSDMGVYNSIINRSSFILKNDNLSSAYLQLFILF